jgi:Txe/YoeB family toxin of Txe-Axe toxin-antitoxin module
MYRSWETNNALKNWEKIKSMPKSVKDKLKYFLVDILENPRSLDTVGNPEQLKHTEKEMWSRELTKKDRIVYGMEPGADYDMPEEQEIVVFYQYLGHYQNK